jgi:hypothetical protein
VGSFWVSSQDEVNADLWHFVENRGDWKTFWASAVKGEAATRPPDYVGTKLLRNRPASAFSPVIIARNGCIEVHGLAADNASSICLYNSEGKKIRLWIGKTVAHTWENMPPGFYVIQIEASQSKIIRPVMLTN